MSLAKSRGSRALAAAALGFCLLLTGCGSKVSKENYNKIKVGMTQAEVEGILGTGTVTNDSVGIGGVSANLGKTETWTDGDKSITVKYDNSGKVAGPAVEKGL